MEDCSRTGKQLKYIIAVLAVIVVASLTALWINAEKEFARLEAQVEPLTLAYSAAKETIASLGDSVARIDSTATRRIAELRTRIEVDSVAAAEAREKADSLGAELEERVPEDLRPLVVQLREQHARAIASLTREKINLHAIIDQKDIQLNAKDEFIEALQRQGQRADSLITYWKAEAKPSLVKGLKMSWPITVPVAAAAIILAVK